MKLPYLIALAALLAATAASAADTPSRTSPVDTNAACMDRNVDSSSANCVLKDDGRPRRAYPPKTTSTGAAPSSAPAPGSSAVRK